MVSLSTSARTPDGTSSGYFLRNHFDVAKLDKQTLQQMLDRVSGKEGFRVSVADIKAGRAGAAGQQFPMTGHSVE